jgi:hypothetical protein
MINIYNTSIIHIVITYIINKTDWKEIGFDLDEVLAAEEKAKKGGDGKPADKPAGGKK